MNDHKPRPSTTRMSFVNDIPRLSVGTNNNTL